MYGENWKHFTHYWQTEKPWHFIFINHCIYANVPFEHYHKKKELDKFELYFLNFSTEQLWLCCFIHFWLKDRVILYCFYTLFQNCCVVLCIVYFVLFYVLFVCKCVLPPGDNPTAVNKYIVSYIIINVILLKHNREKGKKKQQLNTPW